MKQGIICGLMLALGYVFPLTAKAQGYEGGGTGIFHVMEQAGYIVGNFIRYHLESDETFLDVDDTALPEPQVPSSDKKQSKD